MFLVGPAWESVGDAGNEVVVLRGAGCSARGVRCRVFGARCSARAAGCGCSVRRAGCHCVAVVRLMEVVVKTRWIFARRSVQVRGILRRNGVWRIGPDRWRRYEIGGFADRMEQKDAALPRRLKPRARCARRIRGLVFYWPLHVSQGNATRCTLLCAEAERHARSYEHMPVSCTHCIARSVPHFERACCSFADEKHFFICRALSIVVRADCEYLDDSSRVQRVAYSAEFNRSVIALIVARCNASRSIRVSTGYRNSACHVAACEGVIRGTRARIVA